MLVTESEPVGQADGRVQAAENKKLFKQELVHAATPSDKQLQKPTQGGRSHPVLVDDGHSDEENSTG